MLVHAYVLLLVSQDSVIMSEAIIPGMTSMYVDCMMIDKTEHSQTDSILFVNDNDCTDADKG